MRVAPSTDSALNQIVDHLVAWGVPRDEATYTLHGAVEHVALDPREQLFAQNTPITRIYLLQQGNLFQERIDTDAQGRRRVTMRRAAQPGEWIGHYDLIFGRRYGTRARALDFTDLIAVDAGALNRLLNRYPRLRHRVAPMDKIGRLRTLPLFGALDLVRLAYVADATRAEPYPANTLIYEPTDTGDTLFIVDQGQVILSADGTPDIRLGNGMAFGFVDAPVRQADAPPPTNHQAKTAVPTTLFAISRRELVDLADLDPEAAGIQLYRTAQETLARVTVFADYTDDERRDLLGYMSHYFIPTQHVLMQQGEVGDSLWILLQGSGASLHALESGRALQPAHVQGPNFFGELALRVEQPLNSTVQAEAKSQWLRLHTDDFATFVRDHGPAMREKLRMSPAAERALGQTHMRRRYDWLQSGENLIEFQRRHWISLLRNVSFSLILSALLVVAWIILGAQGWLAIWAWWLIALFGVVSVLQFAWGLIDYLNDYLLVTNQRLVRQEKVLFMAEWRQAAFLEQIRSVDVSTTFFGNMFGYGELLIQTAATSGGISFDFVPDPMDMKSIILEQQSLREQAYQASSRMVIQNLLEERFGLRLGLPDRVRPELPAPTIQLQETWRDRLRSLFDINRHLALRIDDRIVWRKHWFILLSKVAGPALVVLAVILMLVGQQFLAPGLLRIILPLDILLVLIGLGALGWTAWIVADWRNDTYEVDSRQIADVEKKPLFFSEQRRTALLGEIENIEVRIPSPLHYLLNFGTVRLQTAATEGEFAFAWVPDPRGVAEEVRRRIEQYRHQQEANRARQRAQELPDWFEVYNRLDSEREPER